MYRSIIFGVALFINLTLYAQSQLTFSNLINFKKSESISQVEAELIKCKYFFEQTHTNKQGGKLIIYKNDLAVYNQKLVVLFPNEGKSSFSSVRFMVYDENEFSMMHNEFLKVYLPTKLDDQIVKDCLEKAYSLDNLIIQFKSCSGKDHGRKYFLIDILERK